MTKPTPRFIFDYAMQCLGEAYWQVEVKPFGWQLRYRWELFKAETLSPFWWWA